MTYTINSEIVCNQQVSIGSMRFTNNTITLMDPSQDLELVVDNARDINVNCGFNVGNFYFRDGVITTTDAVGNIIIQPTNGGKVGINLPVGEAALGKLDVRNYGNGTDTFASGLWASGVFGSASSFHVGIGVIEGAPVIGAFNSDLTAWENLHLQTQDGCVVVGSYTTTPRAKVHIEGYGANYTVTEENCNCNPGGGGGGGGGGGIVTDVPHNAYYTNHPNTEAITLPLTGAYSLYAEKAMFDYDIFVASDERVKKNIVSISKDDALCMVRKMNPCKYDYINNVAGKKNVYGFIAQEMREIIDSSVSVVQDYIPNVFEHGYLESDGTIVLSSKNADNTAIVVGTRLKFYNSQNKIFYGVVKSVISSGLFKISSPNKENVGKCFVYGTNVNDFNLLDKNCVFTVGIAAVKALDEEFVEMKRGLQLLNQQLQERILDLEAETACLSDQVEEIKKMLKL